MLESIIQGNVEGGTFFFEWSDDLYVMLRRTTVLKLLIACFHGQY